MHRSLNVLDMQFIIYRVKFVKVNGGQKHFSSCGRDKLFGSERKFFSRKKLKKLM